jgi:glycosyltransferase involved in cell wall biosynthesis
MQPLISIIIPTYKRLTQLERLLLSIQSNNIRQIDIIVIDDDPEMSAAMLVSKHKKIRYIAKRGINRGLSISRNLGISLSIGKYLMFIDDDDYLYDTALESYLEQFEPSTAFYYSNFNYVRSTGIEHNILNNLTQDKILVVNHIPVGAYMIEKSTIQSGFDPLMKSHEDWEFLLKNVRINESKHISTATIAIDKTGNGDQSMQIRRHSHFWLDFIAIYGKFPAPNLAKERSAFLLSLGLDLSSEALTHSDTY